MQRAKQLIHAPSGKWLPVKEAMAEWKPIINALDSVGLRVCGFDPGVLLEYRDDPQLGQFSMPLWAVQLFVKGTSIPDTAEQARLRKKHAADQERFYSDNLFSWSGTGFNAEKKKAAKKSKPKMEKCWTCKGTGSDDPADPKYRVDCRVCGGVGKVPVKNPKPKPAKSTTKKTVTVLTKTAHVFATGDLVEIDIGNSDGRVLGCLAHQGRDGWFDIQYLDGETDTFDSTDGSNVFVRAATKTERELYAFLTNDPDEDYPLSKKFQKMLSGCGKDVQDALAREVMGVSR
jgi:hypothetical protein